MSRGNAIIIIIIKSKDETYCAVNFFLPYLRDFAPEANSRAFSSARDDPASSMAALTISSSIGFRTSSSDLTQ